MYNTCVCYHHRDSNLGYDSSTLGGRDTLESAKIELQKDIDYYLGIDCIITEATIILTCDNCHGKGTIFIPQKRNKWIGKTKKCPICKGINSEVLIEKVI